MFSLFGNRIFLQEVCWGSLRFWEIHPFQVFGTACKMIKSQFSIMSIISLLCTVWKLLLLQKSSVRNLVISNVWLEGSTFLFFVFSLLLYRHTITLHFFYKHNAYKLIQPLVETKIKHTLSMLLIAAKSNVSYSVALGFLFTCSKKFYIFYVRFYSFTVIFLKL